MKYIPGVSGPTYETSDSLKQGYTRESKINVSVLKQGRLTKLRDPHISETETFNIYETR
jgi:hypothetical protein